MKWLSLWKTRKTKRIIREPGIIYKIVKFAVQHPKFYPLPRFINDINIKLVR